MAAPDFTALDEEGEEVRLSRLPGQAGGAELLATWCGYCKLEMPDFQTAL